MKEIVEVKTLSYQDWKNPRRVDMEYLICSCYNLLYFPQKERQRFETVKITCPLCGCKIIYGGSF